jgi:LuxR family maltose regulon positive regulatory protein
MRIRYERFSTPVLNKKTVKRRQLIALIDTLSRHGILFIHSPAGYGKTTAVATWAKGKNVAWISIDEYSSEPADVYKWLLFALGHDVAPDAFAESPVKYALNAMQELAAWPSAVIIDDFHLCSCSELARDLPLIRSRMPVTTALIIISRNPPPAILTEQMLKGHISEIDSLKFSGDEIIALFNKNNLRLSKYEAEIICQQTDGWPAALAAILLTGGGGDALSDGLLPFIKTDNALHNYFRIHVFDYGDDYHILKKCAICDMLTPDLCTALTERGHAWDVIESMADKTGLIYRVGRDMCSFHSLLKEFLQSELKADDAIDKTALYITAARHFKNSGDILRALDMASKSGDTGLLEEYLRARFITQFKPDLTGYMASIVKYVHAAIPASTIKKSLRFSLDCFTAMFFEGLLTEACQWLDAAEELLSAGGTEEVDAVAAVFNILMDPRREVTDFPSLIIKYQHLLSKRLAGRTNFFSVTSGFPFFHKAQVDYSGACGNVDAYIAVLTPCIAPVLGRLAKPLSLILEAGLKYEMGYLDEAEALAWEAEKTAETPELRFSAKCLYAEILRLLGKKYDAQDIGAMITSESDYYLSANYDAFMTNISLYAGDANAAGRWLAQAETEPSLKFYKIYRYFTSVRALIVAGRFNEAARLTEKLADLALSYRRPCDVTEAGTLRAVCLWHMRQTDEAVRAMVRTVSYAKRLGLVTPIAKEGADVLPILQRILNRLKYGYDADIVDKGFVNELFLRARLMPRSAGHMTAGVKNKPIKLSSRQTEILKYLEENLSHREIGERIGIKVTTVVDHLGKLYEKLEVTNARDAVLKAKMLGIN